MPTDVRVLHHRRRWRGALHRRSGRGRHRWRAGHLQSSRPEGASAGLHAVAIDYRQSGGDYRFDWTWARDASPLDRVPSWRLVSRRGTWPIQRAARLIDLSLLGLAAVLSTWIAVSLRTKIDGASRRHPVTALLVLFVALAVIQTWPLAADPARLSRRQRRHGVDNGRWHGCGHQAVTDSSYFFDANIFHPERYTLAYSESMIVQSAMAAPLLWSGALPCWPTTSFSWPASR